MLFRKPDLLLLDEPTNHLDMGARAALDEALESYTGTFILVAHDRDLLEAVCERFWVVEEETIRPLPGSLDDYLEGVAARRQEEAPAAKKKTPAPREKTPAARERKSVPPRPGRDERRRAAEARNWIHRKTRDLKKKSQELEARIHSLEAEEDELKCRLADPGLYDEENKAKLAELLARHKEVAGAIRSDMDEWEKAANGIEDIKASFREGK